MGKKEHLIALISLWVFMYPEVAYASGMEGLGVFVIAFGVILVSDFIKLIVLSFRQKIGIVLIKIIAFILFEIMLLYVLITIFVRALDSFSTLFKVITFLVSYLIAMIIPNYALIKIDETDSLQPYPKQGGKPTLLTAIFTLLTPLMMTLISLYSS